MKLNKNIVFAIRSITLTDALNLYVSKTNELMLHLM